MTSTVIPFPRLNIRALSAASAAVAGELAALERFLAVTGRALEELRTTEVLIGRASEALEAGDLDEMVATRDILAARIEQRKADHERRAAPTRSAAR